MADFEPPVLLRLAAIAAAGTADRVLTAAMDRGDALSSFTDKLPAALRERAAAALNQVRSGLTGSLADLLNDLPEPVIERLAGSGDVPGEARRIVEEAIPDVRDDVARLLRDVLDRGRGPKDPPADS